MQNCYLNLSHMELEGNYFNKHLHGFKSDWINIFSAVPQGSILGPLISVCDLLDVIYNYYMFADNTKLYHTITSRSESDCNILQQDLNNVMDWGNMWLTIILIFIESCFLVSKSICNGCNMAMGDLPDMYARSPRAAGLRADGIHIRQITNGHVTTIMYHFVPIVTTPVVSRIPQVNVTLVCKVISTNC